MKDTILRLCILHGAVLVLAALGSFFFWGWSGSLSSLAGALSFSLPVLAFSGMVYRASQGETGRFIGRFMAAEALKWVCSASLLALCFGLGLFHPHALLAGFLLSVVVQVIFPIFVPKVRMS